MIRTLPAAMILTAVLAPAPALAKGTIIVAPVYSQLVAFPAPAGFHAINEAEQDGSYILELAPQGDTQDGWSQMLTLTGAKGGASGQSVLDVATSIAKGYHSACPATFPARSFPGADRQGRATGFRWLPWLRHGRWAFRTDVFRRPARQNGSLHRAMGRARSGKPQAD